VPDSDEQTGDHVVSPGGRFDDGKKNLAAVFSRRMARVGMTLPTTYRRSTKYQAGSWPVWVVHGTDRDY